MSDVRVSRWTGAVPPDEAGLRRQLAGEGLQAYSWANGPGDVYGAHSHSYDKVILVVFGSITFGLPQRAQRISLAAGDRLDLPAGEVHDAVVGSEGVLCLEAHR